MLNMLKLLPVSFFFLIWLFGCRSSVDVSAHDLVGTWTITDASRSNLPPALRKASTRLVLDASGTFSVLELPGSVLYLPSIGESRLVTGNGVWNLGSRNGAERLELEFRKITDLRKGDDAFNTYMEIAKTGTATTLFYYDGDPDAGRRVDFERH